MLNLDNKNRLIAAVAVGALVIGGGGMLLGRSMAPSEPAPAAAPAQEKEEGHVEGQILMDEARAKGAGIITETIAVTMLIGNNVLTIPHGIMRAGSTMPSVIANEFTEANQPFHLDSLFVVAFALLLLSLLVNVIGKRIVGRVSEHIA